MNVSIKFPWIVILHTVSGKKSRAASPLDDATVERTLVSSMDITTAPLANRAILPVSKVIERDPISNSSLKVSRTFIPGTGICSEMDGDEDAKPRWPLQIVRYRRDLHVRYSGSDVRRGFLLLAMPAMAMESE